MQVSPDGKLIGATVVPGMGGHDGHGEVSAKAVFTVLKAMNWFRRSKLEITLPTLFLRRMGSTLL